MPLYFSCGLNINPARMMEICKSAEPIGPAVLANHQLYFRGYSLRWMGGTATATQMEGAQVSGFIWEISSEDLEILDGHEDHKWGCNRKTAHCWTKKDNRRVWHEVEIYQLISQSPLAPRELYLDLLVDAYKEAGISRRAVDSAVERAERWEEISRSWC